MYINDYEVYAGGSKISKIVLNNEVLYELNEKEFAIEYTIEPRNTSDKVNSYFSNGFGTVCYYYLPRIYTTDSSTWSVTGYDKIEITKKDGTITDNVTTLASEVEKIKVWYPKDTTYNIRFQGCNSSDPCYVNSILNDNKLNTSNLTSLSYMFYYCSKLTSLNLSSFDTSKVTSMSNMFYYCNKLTSLDLSSFDTSKVTNMYHMFYYCTSLTSLDLSNFNTSSVTDMGYMFGGCNKLTSLDLSNFDTSKVTSMSSMFKNVPTTVDWNYTSSNYTNFTLTESQAGYSGIFPWNQAYIEYTIEPRNTTDYVSSTSDSGCYDYLPRIYTDSSRYSKPISSNVLITKKDGTITNNLSTLASDVEKIKVLYNKNDLYKFSFYGSSSSYPCRVKDILSVKNCIKTDISYMFSYCSSLTSLDLSNWDTSNVTSMTSMFYNCNNLTSLDLSNWNTSNVTKMNLMFYYCTSLRSLNLSNWNTSNVTSMDRMFYYCDSLRSLDLSNFNTSNVTNMDGMFHGCSSLTSLDLSNFNTSNVTSMSSMFNRCSSLTSLDLSSFNTSKVGKYSAGSMFSDVPSKCKIYVGSNFTLTLSQTDRTGNFTRV